MSTSRRPIIASRHGRRAQGHAELPIASIKIGERLRRDFGDVESMAADMAAIGLINPITVTPDGLLLCGERRLRAAKLLGWKTIPVIIKRPPP